MTYLAVPLVLALGAVGRRGAGGAYNQWFSTGDTARVMGDTPARILYGVTIALAALLGGAPWWQAAGLVPLVWVGTTTGNFHSMGMGRAQTSYLHDCFGMSAHAALSAALPTAWAYAFAWWWMLGLTMLAAPLYSLGWMISGREGRPSFPIGLRGGSEIGEALWGASCALGAFMTYGVMP